MIRIITDSTSDLGLETAAQLGVDILPLTVLFGEESFRDQIDISNQEFFAKLNSCSQLPTTSQVTPGTFEELFTKYTQQGDDILVISISEKLSGTFQSATIAKEMVDAPNIYLVDSSTASAAQGLLIRHAVKLRDQGKNAGEIAEIIQELSDRAIFMAVVDTLKYLKMGGRISAATAAMGGLLGIKPVIHLRHGVVSSIGKGKGQKAAFKWMLDQLTGEMEPDLEYGIGFCNANATDSMAEWKEMVMNALSISEENTYCSEIGSVIGTHTGPGCVGIAFVAKKQ